MDGIIWEKELSDIVTEDTKTTEALIKELREMRRKKTTNVVDVTQRLAENCLLSLPMETRLEVAQLNRLAERCIASGEYSLSAATYDKLLVISQQYHLVPLRKQWALLHLASLNMTKKHEECVIAAMGVRGYWEHDYRFYKVLGDSFGSHKTLEDLDNGRFCYERSQDVAMHHYEYEGCFLVGRQKRRLDWESCSIESLDTRFTKDSYMCTLHTKHKGVSYKGTFNGAWKGDKDTFFRMIREKVTASLESPAFYQDKALEPYGLTTEQVSFRTFMR